MSDHRPVIVKCADGRTIIGRRTTFVDDVAVAFGPIYSDESADTILTALTGMSRCYREMTTNTGKTIYGVIEIVS